VQVFFNLQTDVTKVWWSRQDAVASSIGAAITAVELIYVLLEWRHIFVAEQMLERAVARAVTVQECRRKDALCEELTGRGRVRGQCIAVKWRQCRQMLSLTPLLPKPTQAGGEGGGVLKRRW